MPDDASPVRPLGRSHPLTRRVRLLARSPGERERQRVMLVEGVRLAEEALAQNVRIEEALLSPRLERDDRGRRLAARLRSKLPQPRHAPDDLLSSLSDTATHQGVLLLVERPDASFGDVTALAAGRGTTVLVAWEVQDPGNVGTLVRLTDAAGGTGLLAVGGADPFGPRAVRASAGSIFRLPVARLGHGPEAHALPDRLRAAGLLLAGAVARGGTDYRRADLSRPTALMLGGEADGLPAGTLEQLDLRITIPMNPRVESLNVAAAAAVLLFEAAARRRPAESPGEE